MKIIKHLPLILLLSFISTNLFSQHNEKLLVKYDVASLDQLKQNNPNEYNFLVYYVDKGTYFVEMPSKPINYIDLEKVNPLTGEINNNFSFNDIDFDNFNPLEFNCECDMSHSTYYKVGDTGKLLIVLSRSKIENRVQNENRILQNNK